jgi:hypothetical protein
MKINLLYSLGHTDVITAKISDHQFIIHNNFLFWNIMMQGKKRAGTTDSYNNGFGIEETDKQYIRRLQKVSLAIAEMVFRNPDILSICLCEGPIEKTHIFAFIQVLKAIPWMQRFLIQDQKAQHYYKPMQQGTNWGLIMMTDQRYQVNPVSYDCQENTPAYNKLVNRLQIWQLRTSEETRYVALGHFPFGGDEYAVDTHKLSIAGKTYGELIDNLHQEYADRNFTFCGDYNFNPYLISRYQDRIFDNIPHQNSILLVKNSGGQTAVRSVTVDGILLSRLSKQQYASSRIWPGLFRALKQETGLVDSGHNQKFIAKL